MNPTDAFWDLAGYGLLFAGSGLLAFLVLRGVAAVINARYEEDK